jgi:hypothetical protein
MGVQHDFSMLMPKDFAALVEDSSLRRAQTEACPTATTPCNLTVCRYASITVREAAGF